MRDVSISQPRGRNTGADQKVAIIHHRGTGFTEMNAFVLKISVPSVSLW
jgi:hypothetical protein